MQNMALKRFDDSRPFLSSFWFVLHIFKPSITSAKRKLLYNRKNGLQLSMPFAHYLSISPVNHSQFKSFSLWTFPWTLCDWNILLKIHPTTVPSIESYPEKNKCREPSTHRFWRFSNVSINNRTYLTKQHQKMRSKINWIELIERTKLKAIFQTNWFVVGFVSNQLSLISKTEWTNEKKKQFIPNRCLTTL